MYAAVTFPSNDVTYDNTESGLKSKDVQGAIDELYTECTTTPAGDQIIEDAGLEKDQYECRYFFTGANPNNYITFNDEQAKWRIVSVECDGTIKIMKNESIGTMAWDSSSSNNWARPASLNTYLNETYYNSLTNTARSQIVVKDWNIGAVTPSNNNLATQIINENGAKWNGKVALITVSEYIRSNSNKNSCGTFSLNNANYKSCVNTSWMYTTSIVQWWMLSSYDSNSWSAYSMSNLYNISSVWVDGSTKVRPALYLSSDIKITGGDGSQSNPYQISL